MTILTMLTLVGSVWTTEITDTVFTQQDRLHFANVSISRAGFVSLSPSLVLRAAVPEASVWRTAVDRAGNVYLGTGNRCRVYRLKRGSDEPELVFDAGDGQVLAIAADAQGTIFFGSTPDGKVYRMKPGGTAEQLCATGASYIFCLLPNPDGSLLCGTGDGGKLFSVSPDGKASIVFSSQTHITSLAWLDPGKELLVGTAPAGIVYRLTFSPGKDQPAVSVLYDTPLSEVRALEVAEPDRIFVGANGSPENPGDSGSAAVWCVDQSGFTKWRWASPESVVFAFALPGRGDSNLIVATGNRGIVYSLDMLGRTSILHRTDESQVLCLEAVPSGLWLGTGTMGRLFVAGRAIADSGYFEALPHDCGSPARFGRIWWRAEVPAGTTISFETRSGNSESPDSTWSGWTEATELVRSRQARFIQWRAVLGTGFDDRTPMLRRVDIYYDAANRAPLVRRLEPVELAPADVRRGSAKPQRTITWEADDPDGDSLVFRIYLRGVGEQRWLALADAIPESRHELDTRILPDGWYELRLVASDVPERGTDAALESEMMSRQFAIDNAPPVVAEPRIRVDRKNPGKATVTLSARDALSPLVACRVSVNAGDWIAVEPADGIFDSVQEEFDTTVELQRGPNAVAVWVADNQGNVGVARTILDR